jgi:hypothetical protein
LRQQQLINNARPKTSLAVKGTIYNNKPQEDDWTKTNGMNIKNYKTNKCYNDINCGTIEKIGSTVESFAIMMQRAEVLWFSGIFRYFQLT